VKSYAISYRKGRREMKWRVARSAGAAEAVPSYPFLPTVSRPYHVLISRLPQHRDRVPSGAGYRFTEHGESRPRRRWQGVVGARSSKRSGEP
jgi:hypothetical protein